MTRSQKTDAPTGDIDFRKRCVVRNGSFDRLYYGITATEYDEDMRSSSRAADITDTFDHSEGRGRRAGRIERSPHFFTPGIGRHDEIVLRQLREGNIR